MKNRLFLMCQICLFKKYMNPITQTDNSKSNLKANQSRSISLETMHLGSYYTKKGCCPRMYRALIINHEYSECSSILINIKKVTDIVYLAFPSNL